MRTASLVSRDYSDCACKYKGMKPPRDKKNARDEPYVVERGEKSLLRV